AFTTKPGMWVTEQPGVKAPGTANNTTLRPLKKSPVDRSSGPLAPLVLMVTSGSLSPTDIVMIRSRLVVVEARARSAPGNPGQCSMLSVIAPSITGMAGPGATEERHRGPFHSEKGRDTLAHWDLISS